MRRATLILSDLYLPEEDGREASLPAALELPHLEWLLRFAREHSTIGDWRTWLATELGMTAIATHPVARVAATAFLAADVAAKAWLATPVRLDARLDHVRLSDRGLLRIAAQERAGWCEDFARVFGADLSLHEGGARGFFLCGLALDAHTSDPARLLDADVIHALPRGPGAGELRRLGAEIEMWLHGAPRNVQRERARLPRVSALWLWGGAAPADSPVPMPRMDRTGTISLYGGDPYLAALARFMGTPLCVPPGEFRAPPPTAAHVIVELAPMSGSTEESLGRLDAQWFAPLRAALESGALAAADIVANDACFRVTPRAGWRFWRRERDWLTSLRRRVRAVDA